MAAAAKMGDDGEEHNQEGSDAKPDTAATDAGLVCWAPTFSRSIAVAFGWCIALTSIGASSTFLYYQF